MTKNNNKLSCYEPLPRESQDSFNKFIIYRDLQQHDRSVRKVTEILCNFGESGIFDNKLFKSLQKLCTKWCWIERCKIYDADKQLKLAKKKDGKFNELNDVLLDNVEGLIKYANNLLGEVIRGATKDNGEPYSLITRIKMSKDVSSLLKEAHELLCNLCGRPSTYTSFEFDGNLDVNAEVVETKSTIELISEVDPEFADLYDNNNRTNNTNE